MDADNYFFHGDKGGPSGGELLSFDAAQRGRIRQEDLQEMVQNAMKDPEKLRQLMLLMEGGGEQKKHSGRNVKFP